MKINLVLLAVSLRLLVVACSSFFIPPLPGLAPPQVWRPVTKARKRLLEQLLKAQKRPSQTARKTPLQQLRKGILTARKRPS